MPRLGPNVSYSQERIPDPRYRAPAHRIHADIEQQNLVTVSSILPPHCELIAPADGIATLAPGEITFCIMARAETNEPGRRIAAGIGLARPKDPAHYGYISERHFHA
jgi:arginine decarboxylase